MTMTPGLFSLIVPSFNERENIIEFLRTAHAVLGVRPHEIIVVDDDSPDGTAGAVEEFRKKNPWAKVIRRVGKRGLSSAVVEGFDASQGDILGVMDADLSHDEAVLPRLIEMVDHGADLAVGSRRIPGGGATHWPWYRRLTSSAATALARLVLKLDITDPMSGYFVLKRGLYEAVRGEIRPTGYKILLELYCRAKPAVVREVPFVFRDRKQGHSKLTGSVICLLYTSPSPRD